MKYQITAKQKEEIQQARKEIRAKERLEEMRKEAINNVRRTRGKVRLDDLFEQKIISHCKNQKAIIHYAR